MTLRGAELRPMNSVDLDAVHAVEHAAYSFPWSKRMLSDCLAADYESWVIERNGAIFGYSFISFMASDEGHLLNLCIHPYYHGQGWGEVLLKHVLSLAHSRQIGMIFLEVRVSNHNAQRLYRKAGFHFLGRRLDYYRTLNGEEREDALVYGLELGSLA
ncbi:MAG: ribosomal protein S18-alanine N-acetyltransferase [Candidatus Eutrophobiaceae bacterium]